MNSEHIQACLETIEETFALEAQHILNGEINEIGALARTKVEHLGALSTAIEAGALKGQPSAIVNRVKALQRTAIEHDRHLQAMRFGLSRILERLDRIQSDAHVGSYNQYGDRVQFSGARGGFNSKD